MTSFCTLASSFALLYSISMRILIATGIFEPEAGGPATFAPKLARLLTEKGWDVTVLTYSTRAEYDFDSSYPFTLVRIKRGGPSTVLGIDKIFNRIRFFFAMLRHARDRDLIYTLDWFAVGLPVALAAKFLEKPYIVRVGGDYLWEQWYLESGARPVTLSEFYARRMYMRGIYYVLYQIIRFVLSGARHVIFNSDIQKDLYMRPYHLSAHSVSVCYNPVPRIEFATIVRGRPNHEFVYWGRFSAIKNLTTLVRAFGRARLPNSYTLTLIGSGPQSAKILETIQELRLEKRVKMEPVMRPHEVLARIKDARAFILPSWTDISPNQVHEALAIGLPGIVTKENYLKVHDQLPGMIDPSSIDDIATKLTMLADERTYADFATRFKAIVFDHDWNSVADEHRSIFASVLGKTESELRVLQIGADRSKRGILYVDSTATMRQKAYGEKFGHLDIIGFSRANDGRQKFEASKHVHVYPTNSISPLLYGLDALEIARTLPRPDVISVQDPFETGLTGWLIALVKGVPLHVQVHTDFLSPAYAQHSFLNKVRVKIAGFVLRRAKRIRVVSERIKTSIERRYRLSAPVTTLPIFIDLDRFRNAHIDPKLAVHFARFTTKVLVVSRLEPEKNVELAIRAFHEVSPHEACLIVAGIGGEEKKLRALTQELKCKDRVFFENPDDIAPYYTLADLVLVPSKYEGYGLVTIEALATGTPVLSIDVGIAREAGAIVTSEAKFADALSAWFKSGPREGHLNDYPYTNFDEYVRAYCDDIRACRKGK